MSSRRAPAALGLEGRKFWREISSEHELDAMQEVLLHEACRAIDRLEKLNALSRGESASWVELGDSEAREGVVVLGRVLEAANATANNLKQLLAALRLTDPTTGKRPRRRGGARGVYVTGGTGRRSPRGRPKPPLGFVDHHDSLITAEEAAHGR